MTYTLICISVLVLSISLNYLLLNFYNNLESLTETDKCPACYGTNLCADIYLGKFILEDWTQFKLLNFLNSKNVYYASLRNGSSQKVVIKKLAHNSEMDDFDKLICTTNDLENCNVSHVIKSLAQTTIQTMNLKSHNLSLAIPNIIEYFNVDSDIMLCPSKRKLDDIFKAVSQFVDGSDIDQISVISTMIILNQEPIILQLFNEEDIWFLPKYYGSCGRLICEEYVGKRLTAYYYHPFSIRAKIAIQLLELAMVYTDNRFNYSLYLTDPAPENFAVHDENGEVTVKLIDAESIIVVDKMGLKNEKQNLHVSSATACRDEKKQCFSFSIDDLCKYSQSDHNYFAVCSVILSNESITEGFPGGFLHSIPEEKYGPLNYYLVKCRDPMAKINFDSFSQISPKVNNRVEAAKMLIKLLNKIIFNI